MLREAPAAGSRALARTISTRAAGRRVPPVAAMAHRERVKCPSRLVSPLEIRSVRSRPEILGVPAAGDVIDCQPFRR